MPARLAISPLVGAVPSGFLAMNRIIAGGTESNNPSMFDLLWHIFGIPCYKSLVHNTLIFMIISPGACLN